MSKGFSGRVFRSGAAAAMLVGLAALPPAARAADLSFLGDSAVARAVLPHTPWIFDLIIQGSRSFAEITYDRRGYDPVTNTFFVTGLHVKRDAADVAIGRLRTDLASVMLEDVAVDTRGLDLPPELREGLRKLGRDRIEGDVLLGIRMDAARSAYDIAMRYDLPDIGALALDATIDDFHVLVPLSDLEYGAISEEPSVTGSLIKGSVAYKDYGLMPAAIDISAQQAGMSAGQLKAGLLTTPAQFAAQMVDSLPGGASPELKDRIFAWAATAEAFLRNEDAISVTFNPAEPVPLERLQAGLVDEALIAALNPTVSHGFGEVVPAAAAPGSFGQASALISGTGAPQDREAGARALMTLAASGDLAALRTLAATFGTAPAPDLAPDELASLYSCLLVVRALDDSVGDSALSALTTKLSPDAVLVAERDAARYFATHGGADRSEITAETIGGYDANAIRAEAYDLYEGHGVPRSFTRALALALVASAAGDPFAGNLRDSLTAAAQRKDIVLGLADARAEAARLWPAYQASHSGQAQ